MGRKTLTPLQKQKIGTRCINCGTDEMIEYHHVVPIALGGNDIIENIVPLCHSCHKATHCGQHISHYVKTENSGRKPKATLEESKETFDLYIRGAIGNRQVCEELGYSNRTPIIKRPVFKKYLIQKGIKNVRNLVDVVYSNKADGLKEGDIVGEIAYVDGKVEPIIYKDLGVNNNKCAKRKRKNRKPELIEKGA